MTVTASPTTPTALTRAEALSLRQCEEVIAKGERTFIAVGTALRTIRDERLYRDTHGTFDAYVQERWSMTRKYGYYLIAAAQTVEAISVSTTVDIPNEATARVLRQVIDQSDEATAIAALEQADAKGKVTAQAVADAYEEIIVHASAAANTTPAVALPVVTAATLAAIPAPPPPPHSGIAPATFLYGLLQQVAAMRKDEVDAAIDYLNSDSTSAKKVLIKVKKVTKTLDRISTEVIP